MSRKTVPVRERILDTALRMLGESGVRTLAQPKVARRAGVPQGHLTYYFPKRMDLLAAVAARFVERLREDVPALAAFATDARARLDAAGRRQAMRFVARLAKDRARTRTVIGLVAAAEEDAALRRQMADHVKTLRGLVAKLVERDVRDPDVDLALATLWGIGLMHLVLEDRSDAETQRLLDRFLTRIEAS
ncbi:MAG: TetR family transcriptional regulator [Labilithrix sp.]|nr:TetR family transcriptional regulator [Labilithrix sp.]